MKRHARRSSRLVSDLFLWHLTPEFSEKGNSPFNHHHWWMQKEKTAVSVLGAQFEVIRRHPSVKNILERDSVTDWKSNDLAYFLSLHALSTWEELSHADKLWFQSLVPRGLPGVGHTRRKGIYDLTPKSLVGIDSLSLAEKKEIEIERESTLGLWANQQFKKNRIIIAVDRDIPTMKVALDVFEKLYQRYHTPPPHMRNRHLDWLHAIQVFECSEQNRKRCDSRDALLFRAYKSLLEVIDNSVFIV